MGKFNDPFSSEQSAMGVARPKDIPADMAPKGSPDNLTDDGRATAEVLDADANRALGEFAGVKSGRRISSMVDQGKADIPMDGGPKEAAARSSYH